MGKKNKKFKKHAHKHSTQYSVPSTQSAEKTLDQSSSTGNIETDTKVTTSTKTASEISPDETKILNERYTYVRRDVRKLMFVLSVLVILFVATYFLNTKTTVLDNFGDWIYKIGHFSI